MAFVFLAGSPEPEPAVTIAAGIKGHERYAHGLFIVQNWESTTLATRETKRWQYFLESRERRETGAAARKTPKSDKVRRRDWTDVAAGDPEAFYDLDDISDSERVMPKGEIEARRKKTAGSPLHSGIGLAGLDDAARVAGEAAPAGSTDGQAGAAQGMKQGQGTVIEVSTSLCRVRLGEGAAVERTLLCSLRNSLRVPHSGFSNVVAAGDRVVVSYNGSERGVVEAVLPRRSALARPDVFYSHLQQVIVANVDQLLIVASWREPKFWPELVDRYLIAGVRHNLAPVICINKIDLAEDEAELRATAAAYRRAGYRVILTSAVTETGLDELRAVLRGKTTALAGLSGVGKSSLLSEAEPGLNLKVGEVSDRQHLGKHTTTQVSLHALAAGGFVADTPGIREMGLAGLSQAELPALYPEFAAFAASCAYANCSHTREPGCAVKNATRTGRLSPMRYDSYRKIREDLPG
jgi:ribosome biogenesis GTPase